MKISEPKTEEELEEYFEFRWKMLRAPFGLERGSEKDQLEDVSYHIAARSDDGELIGVAKYKPYSESVAQISHIAVDESCRGQGLGKQMVAYLERVAKERSYQEVFLTAREYNIPYFEKLGYELGEEAESPLPDVKIFKMHKKI